MREIGPTLKRAREDAHLTQEAVAKMIGVSVWTYNRLERGYRNCDAAPGGALSKRPLHTALARFAARGVARSGTSAAR
jgi:transcriptional regulator with XRE-family HTH domain